MNNLKSDENVLVNDINEQVNQPNESRENKVMSDKETSPSFTDSSVNPNYVLGYN